MSSEATLPAIYCPECGRVHDPYNRTGETECECGRDWDDLEVCPNWLVDKELERLINKRHNTDLTAQLATVTRERDEARAERDGLRELRDKCGNLLDFFDQVPNDVRSDPGFRHMKRIITDIGKWFDAAALGNTTDGGTGR